MCLGELLDSEVGSWSCVIVFSASVRNLSKFMKIHSINRFKIFTTLRSRKSYSWTLMSSV